MAETVAFEFTMFVIYADALHFFVKCVQTRTGFAVKLDG